MMGMVCIHYTGKKPLQYNMVHCQKLKFLANHMLRISACIGLLHIAQSLKIACTPPETCLCNPQSTNRMHPKNEKISVTSLVQGCSGIYWLRDKLGFCLHLEYKYLRQSSQFRINFTSWSLNPCQWTVSFACSLHLFRPKLPSWISFKTASCCLAGTTIKVPFKRIPSSIVSSSLNVQ